MLTDCSPPHLVARCLRTYQLAAALLGQQGRTFDAEALYIASALHDLAGCCRSQPRAESSRPRCRT